jgi:hypothetical protein
MYSIRIRTNYRLNEYRHADKAHVGVLLKSGKVRFCKWRGFTLDVVYPVKLQVEAFTNENDWEPMNKHSKMPTWTDLKAGEYLLGSWNNGFVYTALPFRIV